MLAENEMAGTRPGDRRPRYTTTWCTLGLLDEATGMDDLIAAYEGTAQLFRDLKAAGVILDGRVVDEIATLSATDPEVAARYGLKEDE